MSEILHEQTFQITDGSEYRVRITRNHPTHGHPVPGVRFLHFVDVQGRPLGIAGVNPTAAEVAMEAQQLESLLRRAQRCSAVSHARSS